MYGEIKIFDLQFVSGKRDLVYFIFYSLSLGLQSLRDLLFLLQNGRRY